MRTPTIATLIALVLLLTGCIPQQAPPEPTPTPVFASEEEALAAAEEAYADYLAMSAVISHEGGKDPRRLSPYVTSEWLEQEVEVFDEIRSSGLRIVGKSAFENMTLQTVDDSQVTVNVCFDATESRVVDSAGVDRTPADRANRFDVQLTFEVQQDGALSLARSDPWLDGYSC